MARAFLIVLDSVGIGGAPDADRYYNEGVPDTGANTVGHIIENRGLNTPNLDALGLRAAVNLASGTQFDTAPSGAYGAATETSRGKDTPSGHWELAGLPVPFDWTYFPDENPAFPPDVTAALINAAGTAGILGNKHASGTAILEELGPEHMRTGWPICYTSVDSVLQIAAHEEVFGRERLYQMCEAMAPMLHKMRVGRVIARPFMGDEKTGFERTIYRRDFALEPPDRTLLDWAFDAGRPVHAIGKIGDIFAHRGVTDNDKGADRDLMEALIARAETAGDGSLTFANFVEFDSKFGHRRDVEGYGAALEWFDAQLPRFLVRLGPGDLAIFTADHGNDPTWIGTDHTRERVPVLVHGIGARNLGHIAFSDVGASVADHLGLSERGAGRSFL